METARFKTSLAGRSVVALVLFVGYYVLAVAMAGLLLLIPYFGVTLHITSGFAVLILYLACLAAAGIILWSIVPRREKFVAPGPRLTPESDPRLFEEIFRIARELDQKAPTEAYLSLGVDAWVSGRGGFMGFGSRRICGVGLGLLGTLSVGEFRAVLAHEFGHFRRGDTRLGPWIFKTRSTIGRTLEHLPELAKFKRIAGFVSLVQQPFVLYANWFMRVTQAISRHQEYLADELSAATAGRNTTVQTLRMICMADMGLQAFWQNLLGRALDAGFLPPVAEGLRLYVEGHKATLLEALNWQITNVQSQPHDSHPALGERLKALEALAAGGEPEAGPPALSLLSDVAGRERELFAFMNPEAGPKLRPLEWSDVATAVLVPHWAKLTAVHHGELAGMTPEDIPGKLPDLAKWGREMGTTLGEALSDDEAKAYAAYVAGLAIVTKMVEQGWQIGYTVGQYTVLSQGERLWEPFRNVNALVSGEKTVEDWLRQCEDLGIADLELGTGGQVEEAEASQSQAGPSQAAPTAPAAAAPATESQSKTKRIPYGYIGLIIIAIIAGI
ncbi:MAG TPA: M48 family metallopeptidase, partial [Acidobacteriota bacterium]|nr:M48 family metallopeptidase [Acidobacteriota bacterium]